MSDSYCSQYDCYRTRAVSNSRQIQCSSLPTQRNQGLNLRYDTCKIEIVDCIRNLGEIGRKRGSWKLEEDRGNEREEGRK